MPPLQRPFYPAVAYAEIGILRDVEDLGIQLVDGVAFGLDLHAVAELAHGIFEGDVLGQDRTARIELLAEHVSRKRDGAARRALLRKCRTDWRRN